MIGGFLLLATVQAGTFHLDSAGGRDTNDGSTAETAWQTLRQAGRHKFQPGDVLQIKRGSRFTGSLDLTLSGTSARPIIIEGAGEGLLPVIDSRGFIAGVRLSGSHHVVLRDLRITSDGGATTDGGSKTLRYGVLVQADEGGSTSQVTLENLEIDSIFPERAAESEGRNASTHLGTGIAIVGSPGFSSTGFTVRNCAISRTGFKAIDLKNLRQVRVLDNRIKDIGGPAIQPGRVDDLVVRGNTVDGSGSSADPRMHARGSGIWPWTCNRVLIEKNTFRHARGPADSCGIHIDFDCRDVIVQYNLSQDNEGGFIEILGNNHNCAYRYNISINDGSRIKKKGGPLQEGKVLWTSGYTGRKKDKNGPYNSYIYNNTIYVGPDSRSCFSISSTTDGILVANNIFHIMGKTVNVPGDQDDRKEKVVDCISCALVRNNLYFSKSVLPPGLPVHDLGMLAGDPEFAKPGGTEATDYIPRNIALVRNRGIPIARLEGDKIGLKIGLLVTRDFFGNPINGNPDLGAVEIP